MKVEIASEILKNNKLYKHYLYLKKKKKLKKNPDRSKYLKAEIILKTSNNFPNQIPPPLTYPLKNQIFCEPLLFLSERIVYIGELDKNFKKQGLGIQIFEDGSIYEGEFKKNEGNGLGRMIFREGDIYKGFLKNFEMDGKGIYFKNNGDVMEGNFLEDLAEGDFLVKYKDGAVFKGNYVKGVKEGFGEFVFPNGDCYKGIFKDNCFCGEGEFYDFLEEKRFKGIFENNKMLETGEIYFKNGDFYEGGIRDYEMNGQGILKTRKKIYKGFFKHNFKEGVFKVFEKGSDKMKDIRYKKGKKINKKKGLDNKENFSLNIKSKNFGDKDKSVFLKLNKDNENSLFDLTVSISDANSVNFNGSNSVNILENKNLSIKNEENVIKEIKGIEKESFQNENKNNLDFSNIESDNKEIKNKKNKENINERIEKNINKEGKNKLNKENFDISINEKIPKMEKNSNPENFIIDINEKKRNSFIIQQKTINEKNIIKLKKKKNNNKKKFLFSFILEIKK